jgi:hypothetical protein
MNKLNIRNLMLGAIAIASLGLTACGGGFSCSDKGKCSKDSAPSDAQISACTKQISSPKCGDKAKAFGQCAKDNEQCGADGTPDGAATLSHCSTQFGDYQACCSANPGDCT